nr:MAG: capsid protein [Cressdnaviricota sp.]
MSATRKNVSAKKRPTKPSYAGYAKAASRSPASSAHRSGSSSSQGGEHGISTTQVIVYDPGDSNTVLPREYYTKLRSTYSGVIPQTAFTAGPGEGNLTLPIAMCCNDVIKPFGNGTVPGGTYPGWVNGTVPYVWMNYGALTTPTTLPSTNVGRLWNQQLYSMVLVTGYELELFLDPSLATTANDEVLVTMTPTFNLGLNEPNNVTLALAQPFTKHQIIRAAGSEPVPCKLYIDVADFVGFTREEFKGDVALNYACTINNITYAEASPAVKLFTIININTLDCTTPSYPIPFTVRLTQYVKFFGGTLADTA